MQHFPVSLIQPTKAVLSGAPEYASLEIKLRPFEFNGELVETSVRLDGIALPSSELRVLVGKNFQFPVNPQPGYIDGSIYLDHAHHPVDVTLLSFSSIGVTLDGTLVFEYEGLDDFANTPFSFTVPVESIGA